MSATKILVVAERGPGGVAEPAFELVAAARALGGPDAEVVALLLGEGLAAAAERFGTLAQRVLVLDDPTLALPDGERDAQCIEAIARREETGVLLLSHTNVGIDLAPGLAARLDAPLVADALELGRDGEGRLIAVRPILKGRFRARVALSAAPHVVATVRPGAYAVPDPLPAPGAVLAEALPSGLASRRRILGTLTPKVGEVDITQAERLVAVGRGIEDEENLDLARSLADALGAELAASRPVVDKGWLPKSRQVGTSGVTVRPNLYVALGISGAFQHLGGIQGSPVLVAINKDENAPIFNACDVGIVGDLFEVVPALVEELQRTEA